MLQDLSAVPGEESGPSALLLVLSVGVCRPPCSTADSGASCSVGTTGQSRGQGVRKRTDGFSLLACPCGCFDVYGPGHDNGSNGFPGEVVTVIKAGREVVPSLAAWWSADACSPPSCCISSVRCDCCWWWLLLPSSRFSDARASVAAASSSSASSGCDSTGNRVSYTS